METGRYMVTFDADNFQAVKNLAEAIGGWKTLAIRGAKAVALEEKHGTNAILAQEAIDALDNEQSKTRSAKAAARAAAREATPAAPKAEKKPKATKAAASTSDGSAGGKKQKLSA